MGDEKTRNERRILRSAAETRGPVRIATNLRVLRPRTHRPPPSGRPPAMPSEKGRNRGEGRGGGGGRGGRAVAGVGENHSAHREHYS